MQGTVYGGQNPVVGARIYLLAANSGVFTPNTSGYGNASLSLLTSAGNTTLDSGGGATNGDYYVTTGSNGTFSISADYTCTLGQQVYLYAVSGNTGSGTNSAAGMLAALGNCPGGLSAFAATDPFVWIDEVSTIATAYAMAGFATDATHVSSSGTALAKVGIANAFANVANLETLGTGAALATTPAANGAAPQTTTNTLANILAACVNSTGPASSACTTLLGDTLSGGTTGTAPTDTATAAINMAHNPAANVSALYGLSTATPPFAPALTGTPNDFTLGIKFSGGGLNTPSSIAIDATGGAWIANSVGNSVTRLTNTGSFVATYTGNGLTDPASISIDSSGSAWVADNPNAAGSVTKITSSGTFPGGSAGYTSGGIDFPFGTAIDGASAVWITDGSAVTKLATSNGAVLSGSGGYTAAGGLNAPTAIAIDGAGNAWMTNSADNMVKLSSTGTLLVQPVLSSVVLGVAADASGNIWVVDGTSVVKFSNAGATLGTFATGGIGGASSVAIDGAGNVWVANFSPSTTSPTHVSAVEFSNSGTALSGANGFGFTTGTSLATFYENLLAVDGSGDVWLGGNGSTNSVTELIGTAAPVITPIAAGLPVTPTANGSSSVGTRP
jgi:hypothetical protein